jgi:hypothetical protein
MSDSDVSQTTSPSSSSQHDDSTDIDELDHRSRKLNKLLRKNVNKADDRKKLLDVVRNRAWVLEDQVNLLEKQTKEIKQTLQSKSFRRKLVMFTAIVSSIALFGYGVNHVVHSSDDNSDDAFNH